MRAHRGQWCFPCHLGFTGEVTYSASYSPHSQSPGDTSNTMSICPFSEVHLGRRPASPPTQNTRALHDTAGCTSVPSLQTIPQQTYGPRPRSPESCSQMQSSAEVGSWVPREGRQGFRSLTRWRWSTDTRAPPEYAAPLTSEPRRARRNVIRHPGRLCLVTHTEALALNRLVNTPSAAGAPRSSGTKGAGGSPADRPSQVTRLPSLTAARGYQPPGELDPRAWGASLGWQQHVSTRAPAAAARQGPR